MSPTMEKVLCGDVLYFPMTASKILTILSKNSKQMEKMSIFELQVKQKFSQENTCNYSTSVGSAVSNR